MSPLFQTASPPQLPITPPATDLDRCLDSSPGSNTALSTAIHVLSTEATALSHLARLYQTDPCAQQAFTRAVEVITSCVSSGRNNKLIASGVGKSGKMAEKLVSTLNSLGVLSTFLHPVEALHGDLGTIRPGDVMLIMTFSGQTSELATLVSHLPFHMPLIMLTGHSNPSLSPISRHHARSDVIILPTPIHESEELSFGVAAPTTSTTVTTALGDALAIAVAENVNAGKGSTGRDVLRGNHPGGAIGLRQ
ncbi:MAG: hypothetical protein M1823_001252 [Watsoniomyces obsoletus]|nr:MAG: hypothetical protein M1823_001252 [Watsoniomyces obsoletus]